MSGHKPFKDLVAKMPGGVIGGRDPIQKMQDQLLLIRVCLGLNPIHDPVECVRVLFEEGREAFEKLRGEPCDYAAQWKPYPPIQPGPDRFPPPP